MILALDAASYAPQSSAGREKGSAVEVESLSTPFIFVPLNSGPIAPKSGGSRKQPPDTSDPSVQKPKTKADSAKPACSNKMIQGFTKISISLRLRGSGFAHCIILVGLWIVNFLRRHRCLFLRVMCRLVHHCYTVHPFQMLPGQFQPLIRPCNQIATCALPPRSYRISVYGKPNVLATKEAAGVSSVFVE
jgi:hypothetical protein